MARTSSTRGFAVTLAAWCLLAPIHAQAHLVLVQHARCAEHGELLHVGAPAAVSDPSDDVQPATEAGPRAQAADSSESHEHDHCVAASARQVQGGTAPATAVLLLPQPRAAGIPDLDEPTQQLARYVLAPKNSPPA